MVSAIGRVNKDKPLHYKEQVLAFPFATSTGIDSISSRHNLAWHQQIQTSDPIAFREWILREQEPLLHHWRYPICYVNTAKYRWELKTPAADIFQST